MRRASVAITACLAILCVASGRVNAIDSQASSPVTAAPPAASSANAPRASERALLDRYCVDLPQPADENGGPDARRDGSSATWPSTRREWEKVVRKLRAGVMPPAGHAAARRRRRTTASSRRSRPRSTAPRPRSPNPGRTETFHRLNRAEYHNAIRDLLALDIDVAALLPADDASYGFDNIAGVLKVSPSLLERYLSAARKISRAGGRRPPPRPGGTRPTSCSPGSARRTIACEGLPFGTRGGTLDPHDFPGRRRVRHPDRLQRICDDRDPRSRRAARARGHASTASASKLFTVERRGSGATGDRSRDGQTSSDAASRSPARRSRPARTRSASRSSKTTAALAEADLREPFQQAVRLQRDRGARSRCRQRDDHRAVQRDAAPATRRAGARSSSAARRDAGGEERAVRARRSSRRSPAAPTAGRSTDADVADAAGVLRRRARREGSFEAGIELALRAHARRARSSCSASSAIRAERRAGAAYRDQRSRAGLAAVVLPVEQHSGRRAARRWRERGQLQRPGGARAAGPADAGRSAVARRWSTNFAGQWLQLRNVRAVDARSEVLFPDFDENLRAGVPARDRAVLRQQSCARTAASLDLLTADYTFLNERLARHYGIPNVYGSHFRRVTLTDEQRAAGCSGRAAS